MEKQVLPQQHSPSSSIPRPTAPRPPGLQVNTRKVTCVSPREDRGCFLKKPIGKQTPIHSHGRIHKGRDKNIKVVATFAAFTWEKSNTDVRNIYYHQV
ncbi:hypothetical protein AV530_000551 [Patagioenas fasciata monilis]|uniref:Uncharacterized protein n=1 Tax=Patagioenas fasciata monilis TaxID=372326 RepID=A0A1V4IFN0_PATFA|nr:hypothetical protein AV530_000551 [Patagioenas fasciata monilis]